MTGWLIALGVLLAVPPLILLIPVRLNVVYNEDGLAYKLFFGLLKIRPEWLESEEGLKPRLQRDARVITTAVSPTPVTLANISAKIPGVA